MTSGKNHSIVSSVPDPNHTDTIRRALRHLRRRMMTQIFLEELVWYTLGGFIGLLAACAWNFQYCSRPSALLAFAVMVIFAVLLSTRLRRPTLPETAARIDRAASTRDRFLTALTLSRSNGLTQMQATALDECARFIRGFDIRLWTKLRIPDRAKWLAVPLAAYLLLAWHERLAHPLPVSAPAATQLLSEKSEALKKLAQQLDQHAYEYPPSNYRKLSEQLRQSAAKLDQQRIAASSNDAARAALRELSALEAAVRALQKSAAEREEQLAQTAPVPEQVAQALRDAEEHLKQQHGAASPATGSAERMDSETLQRLLQAIQNIKYGQPSRSLLSHQKAGEGKTENIEIREPANGKGAAPATALSLPSGLPGGERDTGTTANPFGAKQGTEPIPGQATQLNGVLSEGESLQQLVTASGDDSKAQRRYRDLYNSAAPAAENTVFNESIPLGSRFFVRRYFESIRPKE